MSKAPRLTKQQIKGLPQKIQDQINDQIGEGKKAMNVTEKQIKLTRELKPKVIQEAGETIFCVNPMGKPRMVRSDKWKKRACVQRYWAYKDELLRLASLCDFTYQNGMEITFIIQMPKSWTKKKKKEMDGKPHQQKPDWDNCAKGLQDIFCLEDSHIWHMGEIKKFWGYEGKIIIQIQK